MWVLGRAAGRKETGKEMGVGRPCVLWELAVSRNKSKWNGVAQKNGGWPFAFKNGGRGKKKKKMKRAYGKRWRWGYG